MAVPKAAEDGTCGNISPLNRVVYLLPYANVPLLMNVLPGVKPSAAFCAIVIVALLVRVL